MSIITPPQEKLKSKTYNVTIKDSLLEELELVQRFVAETMNAEELPLARLIVGIITNALEQRGNLIKGLDKKEKSKTLNVTIPGQVNQKLEQALSEARQKYDSPDATAQAFISLVVSHAITKDKEYKKWKREKKTIDKDPTTPNKMNDNPA